MAERMPTTPGVERLGVDPERLSKQLFLLWYLLRAQSEDVGSPEEKYGKDFFLLFDERVGSKEKDNFKKIISDKDLGEALTATLRFFGCVIKELYVEFYKNNKTSREALHLEEIRDKNFSLETPLKKREGEKCNYYISLDKTAAKKFLAELLADWHKGKFFFKKKSRASTKFQMKNISKYLFELYQNYGKEMLFFKEKDFEKLKADFVPMILFLEGDKKIEIETISKDKDGWISTASFKNKLISRLQQVALSNTSLRLKGEEPTSSYGKINIYHLDRGGFDNLYIEINGEPLPEKSKIARMSDRRVLEALVKAQGRICPPYKLEEAIDRVSRNDFSKIHQAVSRLRKIVKDVADIKNTRGVGYLLKLK